MNIMVSVIVPCYNQALLLEEALLSVLNQTYSNWECIIVNDGSIDNTDILAKHWCNKDSRFSYISQENKGPANARNNAIKKSKGEFILPLDADDCISNDFLEKLVPELLNDESLGIVSCYTKFFTDDSKKTIFDLKPEGADWRYLLYVNQLTATSLFRKKCWEEVSGYDETMTKGFEDWEFWINVTKNGWKYKIVKDFLFFYRKAKQSRQVNAITDYFESSREYIYKKHKELYIKDFDNCMTVLFFEINQQRISRIEIRNSFEYKIGKVIMKPYRMFSKLFSKANKNDDFSSNSK